MAVELLGAKMIAPYFGTSPYVWAAVLAVTLFGLALGYLVGGKISKKYELKSKPLSIVLFLSVLVVLIISFLSSHFLALFIQFNFEFGVIFTAFVVLALPLFLFGTVSPILIGLLDKMEQKAGKSAGVIYATSTLGGIICTFLYGFYLIPFIGVFASAISVSFLLIVATLLSFMLNQTIHNKKRAKTVEKEY